MDKVGDLRKNFSRYEFACKDGCGRDMPDEQLLDVLQAARTAKGKPLRIVSGVRCDAHNARVGGSRLSQHRHGRAADVPAGYATIRQWKSYGAIGIGVRWRRVIHVDSRRGRQPFTFRD